MQFEASGLMGVILWGVYFCLFLMIIVSRNVRGLGRPAKRVEVRN